jgi:hypothetical protein
MKVVIYHATSEERVHFKNRVGIYKQITEIFKENVNSFSFPLIHLTTTGHEGWGDENYYYDLDPREINYNRELCFIDFLKNTADPNEVYWFTEPDWRIESMFPPLENDVDFLLRPDIIPLHPGWRLAKKSALPIFEELLDCFYLEQKVWGGDSAGMANFYARADNPASTFEYKGCKVGLRPYKEYGRRKSRYTQQFKADHKEEIVTKYGKSND